MSLISLFKSNRQNIRKAGYLKDQSGIIRRYHNEYKNWDTHLSNCKAFITEAVDRFKGDNVAVLGSGWLLDVPMQTLLNEYETVDLYDVNHPKQVQRKYQNISKINFINSDLTNGLINSATECKNYNSFLDELYNCAPISFNKKYDLVISVNLLNQLDILLCDFLIKRFKIRPQDIKQVRKKIQQNHIDALLNNKACLITDSIEQNIIKGALIQKQNLIYCSIPESRYSKKWTWIFDTHKCYNVKYNTSFIVKAYIF